MSRATSSKSKKQQKNSKSTYGPCQVRVPNPDVVYFNQHLGAAHSKCWLKCRLKKARNLQQIFCFFCFFAEKMLKMTISTSIWSAQHLNAGQNIQHPEQQIVQNHSGKLIICSSGILLTAVRLGALAKNKFNRCPRFSAHTQTPIDLFRV